jgi:hypothetical protein
MSLREEFGKETNRKNNAYWAITKFDIGRGFFNPDYTEWLENKIEQLQLELKQKDEVIEVGKSLLQSCKNILEVMYDEYGYGDDSHKFLNKIGKYIGE